jgi:excisionase family DNA binding protein
MKGETAMQEDLITTKEAAKILCVSKAFLERDRWAGARIPFVKVGSRGVRYRPSDLHAYIESRIRQSTSQS